MPALYFSQEAYLCKETIITKLLYLIKNL